MAGSPTFVIVGASLAGAKAAETLRQEGFDGRMVLIGEEPERPYQRPPAVQGAPAGRGRPGGDLPPPRGLLRRARHRAAPLHPGQRPAPGTRHGWRRPPASPSATTASFWPPGPPPAGCRCRGPTWPGSTTCAPWPTPRTCRGTLVGAGRLAVIGAGWIGCEVAASARQLGVEEVVMIDPLATPLDQGGRPHQAEFLALAGRS